MSKFEKRMLSHELRKKGLSINVIANKLNVSKNSVSLWCRDIPLTKEQRKNLEENTRLAGNVGRMIGAEVNRQKRLANLKKYNERGKDEIGRLSKRDLTLLAAALFWAEGAKTGSRFVFVNSDPGMILLMKRYLIEVEKVESSRIFVTVQINRIHEQRIEIVNKFWMDLLQLPKNQFGKVYYIGVVPKKKYENHEEYYGILRITVRNGASLQYKLLGYINALKF
jgi:predicted transcriptional regulator